MKSYERFCRSIKREGGNTDSHWSKQDPCFACSARVWLNVNHNTSTVSLLTNELEAYHTVEIV